MMSHNAGTVSLFSSFLFSDKWQQNQGRLRCCWVPAAAGGGGGVDSARCSKKTADEEATTTTRRTATKKKQRKRKRRKRRNQFVSSGKTTTLTHSERPTTAPRGGGGGGAPASRLPVPTTTPHKNAEVTRVCEQPGRSAPAQLPASLCLPTDGRLHLHLPPSLGRRFSTSLKGAMIRGSQTQLRAAPGALTSSRTRASGGVPFRRAYRGRSRAQRG